MSAMLSVSDVHTLVFVILFCLIGWLGLTFITAIRR